MFNNKWGLDIRSVALLRIGLGLVFLHNILFRASGGKWDSFFSSQGLLPPSLVSSGLGISFLDSLDGFSIIMFFVIAFISGIFFTLGLFTVVFRWVCFSILLLLAHRFPIFIEGAESAFRLFFLFACLLPLGACFSLDNYIRNRKDKNASVVTQGGTRTLFMGQASALTRPLYFNFSIVYFSLTLAGMYLFNSFEKSQVVGWWDGTSIIATTHDVAMATGPLAPFLRNNLSLTMASIFSLGTIYLEFAIGVGVLLALRLEIMRWFVFLAISFFHLSIALIINVGPFTPVLVAVSLLFLPPSFYQYLQRRVFYKWVQTSPFSLVASNYSHSRGGGLLSQCIGPTLVYLSSLPLVLSGNPFVSRYLPETTIRPILSAYSSQIWKILYTRQEWMQFKNVSGVSHIHCVEVVQPDGTSYFYMRGPIHTATGFYKSPYYLNRFCQQYMWFLSDNKQAREVLAQKLLDKGASQVLFWDLSWDFSKTPHSITRNLRDRFLAPQVAAVKVEPINGVISHVQDLQRFVSPTTKWGVGTHIFVSSPYGLPITTTVDMPLTFNTAELIMTRGPDFGVYEIQINQTPLGIYDFYSHNVQPFRLPLPYGILKGGLNKIVFQPISKNPQSKGQFLGVSGVFFHAPFQKSPLESIEEP